MKRREKLLFLLGASLLGFPLGVLMWVALPFAAWYIGKIPEKRMPLAYYLSSNQKKFYEWASDFLRASLKLSIFVYFMPVFLVIFILVVGRVFIAGYDLGDTLQFLPEFLYSFRYQLYLIIYPATFIGVWLVKHYQYDALFSTSEPTARLLVGNEQYDVLSEYEKQLVLRNAVDSIIGINKGTLVVSGGEIQVKTPAAGDLAKYGGPGILVVQEGHAVVLEQRAKISRIVGRGIHSLQMYERPSMIVPLSLRSEKPTIRNVVTQDQVVIPSIKLFVYHKIEKGTKLRENGMYPFDERVILDKIWSPRGGDWRGIVCDVCETATRDVVARHTLDDLMLASDRARKDLREEIRREVNAVMTAKLGVDVTVIEIGEIELPARASEILLEKWTASVGRQIEVLNAEKDREIMIRKSEGEATALKSIEAIKSSLRDVLIQQLTDPLRTAGSPIQHPEIAKRYIEAIEKLSLAIVRDDVTALRYIEALEKISQSEGQKTVILGDTKDVLGSGLITP